MPFDVTPEERFWVLTAVGGTLAWFGRDLVPAIMGKFNHKRKRREAREDQLFAALSQASATLKTLVIAIELPEEKRHAHVEAAQRAIAEFDRILGVLGVPAPEDALA